jgi:hypothetical protein
MGYEDDTFEVMSLLPRCIMNHEQFNLENNKYKDFAASL